MKILSDDESTAANVSVSLYKKRLRCHFTEYYYYTSISYVFQMFKIVYYYYLDLLRSYWQRYLTLPLAYLNGSSFLNLV